MTPEDETLSSGTISSYRCSRCDSSIPNLAVNDGSIKMVVNDTYTPNPRWYTFSYQTYS